MDSAIHLRSAVALLGRFPVLAGVDLEVSPGETVLLEGPNGSGKTSLLRVCAGLLPLSRGEGFVLGADLSRRARPPRVGFLGHATGLYDDLTALENVTFRARLSGRPGVEADEALARVGLESRVCGVPVAKLSAGQRRRVGIAALLTVQPLLWLLDEPHAGLDADARDALDAVLAGAAADGAAILLASHEVDHVEQLADRRVRIERGRVELSGAAPQPVTEAVDVA